MRRPRKRAAEHPDGRVTAAPPLIDGHALGGLVRAAYVVGRGPGRVSRSSSRWSCGPCRSAARQARLGCRCQLRFAEVQGPLCEVASLPQASADHAVAGGRSLVSLVILACLTWAFTIGAAPVPRGSWGQLAGRGGGRGGCCRRGRAGPVGNCKRDPADRPAVGPVAGTGAGSARGCPHLSGPPD